MSNLASLLFMKEVSSCRYIAVSLYRRVAISLYRYIAILLYRYIAISLYRHIAISPSPFSSVLSEIDDFRRAVCTLLNAQAVGHRHGASLKVVVFAAACIALCHL